MFKKISNLITIPKTVFVLQVATIFLVVLEFLPKDAFLFLTGFLVFYFLFEKIENSLVVFFASVPFFVALPITESFDHMANWRFLIVAIFLSFIFKNKFLNPSFLREKIRQKFWRKINIFESLGIIFLLWLILSLFQAENIFWGVKKVAFFVNIILLYPVLKWQFRANKDFYKRILKALVFGGFCVILVAFLQLALVFWLPLFTFWQSWTNKVIDAFYGSSLAGLLSYSNTWFSYYQSAPPTLRLFSVFPDSHSFAMYLLLILPSASLFIILTKREWLKKIGFILLTFSFLWGIVMSGSRGAWLSFLAAFFIMALIWFFSKHNRNLAIKNALLLLLFVPAFGLSIIYPSALYLAQSYQEGGELDFKSIAFFERARSISDISETSNKGRLEIWDSSLKSISQKPVLGVGVGNFSQVLGEDVSTAKRGASAHNLFLDFASEVGILGMIVLLFLFLKILKMLWQIFDNQKETVSARFLFIALIIYIGWVLSYSLFDVVLLNDKVLLVFVAWLALINYFYKPKENERKSK